MKYSFSILKKFFDAELLLKLVFNVVDTCEYLFWKNTFFVCTCKPIRTEIKFEARPLKADCSNFNSSSKHRKILKCEKIGWTSKEILDLLIHHWLVKQIERQDQVNEPPPLRKKYMEMKANIKRFSR